MTGLVLDRTWVLIGFLGQTLFTFRFMVQWLASEKARRSVTPVLFWWFSLGGGIVLLAYAVHRRDPVFAVGQGSGLLIYLRNLLLIRRERREQATTIIQDPRSAGVALPAPAARHEAPR